MKKIGLYCVTYKSYKEVESFLCSLDNMSYVTNIDLDVFVCDNTEQNVLAIDYQPINYKLSVTTLNKNIGYFGGITTLMSQFSPYIYDYVIISNVDLSLGEDFFEQLINLQIEDNIGWIAPRIYSKSEQRDKNPKIINRYNKRKLSILKYMFRYHWLYNLYTHSVYKRKKMQKFHMMNIYAGHGSFIILTKEFFNKCGIINYPVFLFCEEIYLGEQCLNNNLKVRYTPCLMVYDSEHVSTSEFKSRQYCRYNYLAISYILNKYYSE